MKSSIAAVLKILLFCILSYLVTAAHSEDPYSEGMHHVKSTHNIDLTVERAKRIIEHQELRVFGVIDHTANAKTVGLTLAPTRLLVFGNPVVGTELISANPLIGLDLPLKLLIWEDQAGIVWISYSTAAYLQKRHQLMEYTKYFMKMETLLEDLAKTIAR